MEKASRSLELTIISAEGLRLHGRSVTKNAFVIVRTDSRNQRSTSIDSQGGNYPSWNQKLEPLPLPNSVDFINVEVQCMTSSSSSRVKTVGTAKIALSDFIGGYKPAQHLHFLSYRLRDRKGERNGIINFSMRMVGPDCFGRSVLPPPALPLLPRPSLCTVASSQNQKNASGSGTALGIPVPFPYGYGYGYGLGYGV